MNPPREAAVKLAVAAALAPHGRLLSAALVGEMSDFLEDAALTHPALRTLAGLPALSMPPASPAEPEDRPSFVGMLDRQERARAVAAPIVARFVERQGAEAELELLIAADLGADRAEEEIARLGHDRPFDHLAWSRIYDSLCSDDLTARRVTRPEHIALGHARRVVCEYLTTIARDIRIGDTLEKKLATLASMLLFELVMRLGVALAVRRAA